jgi:signal transduction histidine kinase
LGISLLTGLPFFGEKYILKTLQKDLQKSSSVLTEKLAQALTTETKGMHRAALESVDAEVEFSALSKAWLRDRPEFLAIHLLDREGKLLKTAAKPPLEATLSADFVTRWEIGNRIALAHAMELQEPSLSPLYLMHNNELANIIIPLHGPKQLIYLVTIDVRQWITSNTANSEAPVLVGIRPFHTDLTEDYDRYEVNTAAWQGLWTLEFQSKDPLYGLLRNLRPYVFALTWLIVGLFFLYWRSSSLRQKAELALQAKSETLEKQNRLSLLGEMSAQLAHEINQPLATIANYAAAGKLQLQNPHAETNGALSALFQEILEQTQRAGQVLVAVRAMLQTNAMEMGSFNADDLIQKVEPALRFLCTPNQVRLTVDCNNIYLTKINPILFEQVIFNLVKNSIQSLSETNKSDKRISIGSSIKNGRILIEISDNGKGVDSAYRNQIFESFFTTKSEGLGIGLSLCRSVIERFNGKLTLKSSSPLGACFLIDLPMVDNPTA